MVSASDFGPEGREFDPWPVHPCCVFERNFDYILATSIQKIEFCQSRIIDLSTEVNDYSFMCVYFAGFNTKVRTAGEQHLHWSRNLVFYSHLGNYTHCLENVCYSKR